MTRKGGADGYEWAESDADVRGSFDTVEQALSDRLLVVLRRPRISSTEGLVLGKDQGDTEPESDMSM